MVHRHHNEFLLQYHGTKVTSIKNMEHLAVPNVGLQ